MQKKVSKIIYQSGKSINLQSIAKNFFYTDFCFPKKICWKSFGPFQNEYHSFIGLLYSLKHKSGKFCAMLILTA